MTEEQKKAAARVATLRLTERRVEELLRTFELWFEDRRIDRISVRRTTVTGAIVVEILERPKEAGE